MTHNPKPGLGSLAIVVGLAMLILVIFTNQWDKIPVIILFIIAGIFSKYCIAPTFETNKVKP